MAPRPECFATDRILIIIPEILVTSCLVGDFPITRESITQSGVVPRSEASASLEVHLFVFSFRQFQNMIRQFLIVRFLGRDSSEMRA